MPQKTPLTRKIESMRVNQVLTIPNAKLKKSDKWGILATARKAGFIVVTKRLDDCMKVWRCA